MQRGHPGGRRRSPIRGCAWWITQGITSEHECEKKIPPTLPSSDTGLNWSTQIDHDSVNPRVAPAPRVLGPMPGPDPLPRSTTQDADSFRFRLDVLADRASGHRRCVARHGIPLLLHPPPGKSVDFLSLAPPPHPPVRPCRCALTCHSEKVAGASYLGPSRVRGSGREQGRWTSLRRTGGVLLMPEMIP